MPFIIRIPDYLLMDVVSDLANRGCHVLQVNHSKVETRISGEVTDFPKMREEYRKFLPEVEFFY